MKNIKTITHYNSAHELLHDFCGAHWWNNLDEDDDIVLRHFDGFEGMEYFCVNKTIIITAYGGEVIQTYRNFAAYLQDVESLLEEDRTERMQ